MIGITIRCFRIDSAGILTSEFECWTNGKKSCFTVDLTDVYVPSDAIQFLQEERDKSIR